MSLFLGIDVGTAGSKALLIDADGAVRANVTTEYPLLTPKPLWSEQDPHAWWGATVSSISKVLQRAEVEPRDVSAIGLTGQMHGLVLLDAHGEVLRPAILWNDQRTAAECAAIHQRAGLDRVVKITGKPALTGFTAPKILWVRKHEPEIYASAATMLLPKDYLRFRLSGVFAGDVADASGTSLFDVNARAWSEELIEALDVPGTWLPDIHESPEVCASVSPEAASATGLLAGTPIVAGAGDQAAEAVGCGIVEEGAVSVTLGTSGVVFAATDECRLDEAGRLHAYCHAVPGMWHQMGVMLSAGGSFRWYRDTLGTEQVAQAKARNVDPYTVLIEQAATAPAGCEGLLFLPYLTGERTPHPDPNARGAFIGLTLRHTPAHLTRAVMEGVIFGLRDALELARELGINVSSVRVSGGGARSAFWRQMMADVFRAQVVTVNVTQGAAYGAAILAAVGVGAYPTVQRACASIVCEGEATTPGEDASVYEQFYPRYRALYPKLADEFSAIADAVAAAD